MAKKKLAIMWSVSKMLFNYGDRARAERLQRESNEEINLVYVAVDIHHESAMFQFIEQFTGWVFDTQEEAEEKIKINNGGRI